MKYDLTQDELNLVAKIYQEFDGVTIARAKVILSEVNRLIKELTAIIEERTPIGEVS